MRNSKCHSSMPTKIEAQDLLEAQRQKQDRALDEALELTFPASDPIAVSPGTRIKLRPLRAEPARSAAGGSIASPCSVEENKLR
jgi:hypothetical protein